jgi:transposase-like protein
MTSVKRLPVQHRQRPHCPSCGDDLPDFNDTQTSVAFGGLKSATLDAITYHVTCGCGAKWDLRKTVKK